MIRAEDCTFYQTIELPGLGVMEGAWDHRETVDTYLGHVDPREKRVLDVGPANGFFSFEMEKLGASRVTALDLGQSADWDAVPRPNERPDDLRESLRRGVRRVENAFWLCHQALDSNVELAYGAVYDTPRVIDEADIALIGNVLQHVRDPFLAIERASQVVAETIIISEAIWVDEPSFLENPDLRLLTRVDEPELSQSWWAVSPAAVIQILKLLGFADTRCELHEQKYSRKNCRVRHFTVTGTRPNVSAALRAARKLEVCFDAGWHAEERNERDTWRWSSRARAALSLSLPPGESTAVKLDFRLVSVDAANVELWVNGSLCSRHRLQARCPVELSPELANLREGHNRIEIKSDTAMSQPAGAGSRSINFAVFNLAADAMTPDEIRGSSIP